MSTAAKLTLAGTSAMAVGIVFFVHYAQKNEKAVSIFKSSFYAFPSSPFQSILLSILLTMSQAMHAGVIRDIEQQRVKKERQADFEMQKALEEEYRKVQHVKD